MFIPKEMKFFELFDKQMHNLVEGAELYRKIIHTPEVTRDNVDKIHSIEHRCDEMTHIILNTLNESFITPFDREDIMTLANHMDDIMDGFYMIAKRFYLYKIDNPTEESKKLADICLNAVKSLQKAVSLMRSNKNMREVLKHCIEINRLENLADEIRDEAISRILNDNNANPILVIKQKELIEAAEGVSDTCEHAANVLESILVKNN